MQNLASYGSDSDDEPVASSSTLPSLVAQQPVPSPKPFEPSTTASASQPLISRVKSTNNSRAASPLSGVKLPAPSAPSPRPPPGSPTKSSESKGKQRESSASPPAMSRGAPREDRGESTVGGGPRLHAEGAAGPILGVRMDSLAEFGVPPMAAGPCNPAVEAKIANFAHLARTRGLHFNDSLSASKAFRNPRIYAKLVEFVNVDESGSNWDTAIWDPKGLPEDSTASRIAELQRLHSEARQAGQAAGSRSSIAFASSLAPTSMHDRVDEQARIRDSMAAKSSTSSASKGRDKERERERDRDRDRGGERKRSRWDSGKRDRSRSPARRY